MKRRTHYPWVVSLGILVSWCYLPAQPALAAHEALQTYEGSKSCEPCHEGKSLEVYGTVHYRLKGQTPEVPKLGFAGKIGGINDFCTYPNINWLFMMTNPVTKQQVATGCAVCHIGMGAMPNADPSAAQLENIDCLMCHGDDYARTAQDVGGTLQFVPSDPASIPAITSAIRERPSLATCLTRCHGKSGGGFALKQGDLSPAQLDPPKSLDVHLSSQGAGLHCLDCHTVRQHKFAGRGNDLRVTDLKQDLSCTTCHDASPHNTSSVGRQINKHTDRVDCTVCHIPAFARELPTDVFRDFSRSELDPVLQRYEPFHRAKSNVTPVYKFWNGLSYFYKFGDPIELNARNKFLLAGPLGNITQSNAKLHAFKSHPANVGYDPVTMRMLPLKSKVLWETGDIVESYVQGANAVGWPLTQGVAYVRSKRLMALFHQVAPSEDALLCGNCHISAGRVDFKGLGYTPMAVRLGKPLCASCHEPENAEFYEVHRIHVDEENKDCSTCHKF